MLLPLPTQCQGHVSMWSHLALSFLGSRVKPSLTFDLSSSNIFVYPANTRIRIYGHSAGSPGLSNKHKRGIFVLLNKMIRRLWFGTSFLGRSRLDHSKMESLMLHTVESSGHCQIPRGPLTPKTRASCNHSERVTEECVSVTGCGPGHCVPISLFLVTVSR